MKKILIAMAVSLSMMTLFLCPVGARIPGTEKSSLSPLQEELTKKVDSLEGKWSVCIMDLKKDDTALIHDGEMVSASLIKLFVAGAYFEDVENKKIKDTMSERVAVMLNRSDNDACNELIDLMGKERINTFAKEHGYNDTRLTRKMLENTGTENYTSVSDCAHMLEAVYHGRFVNKKASAFILKNLEAQEQRKKIPAGVPEGVRTANKTGELSSVENDVAIIWSEGTDYILCVMSNDITAPGLAQQEIVDISRTVYDFFNKDSGTAETGS